jgi:hypothetical protein
VGHAEKCPHRDELVLLHVVFLERLMLFIERMESPVAVCCHRVSDAVGHLRRGLLATSHAVAIVGHGHGCVEVVSAEWCGLEVGSGI